MRQHGVANPVWPWGVSLGLHSALLAALWVHSVVANHLGGGYDTAPQLLGATVAPAAHRASSLGDITDDEGMVSFEAVTSSPKKQDVSVDVPPPKPRASESPTASLAQPHSPAKPTEHTTMEASPYATSARQPESSLPLRRWEDNEIAQKSASAAPLPRLPSRAKHHLAVSSDAESSPAVLTRAPVMAALVLPLGVTPGVVEHDDDEAAAGRFIRRGGHLGRDGSVGSDDSSPEPLLNKSPIYPEVAWRNNWDGRVVLRLWISETGHVERVEVATGSGHEVLDDAAVAAVRSWQFRPALRAGRGVAVTVLQPVEFSLHHTSHLSERSTPVSK